MKQVSESEMLHRAAAYCSASERCIQDVEKKIKAAGLAGEESDRIVSRLLQERFIDESRFARYFVNDKLRFNKWGRVRVYYTTVDKWLRNYKAIGPEAFFRKGHTYLTPAQKEAAVFDYLSGKGSLRDICARHKISDAQILRRWIMKYNSHDKETGGRAIMTKGRKTTFEERVEIVQYCIKHSHNYSETAKKFHISYQQARSYTIRYEENGVDGLQDKRGKRKSPEEMTEVEKLRAEVRLLRAEKRRAEIEISFLKKLEEIERRGG